LDSYFWKHKIVLICIYRKWIESNLLR
jgi:hypothetical protein